jgi:glutamate synthase (NADPH/NADH) large chain/glutamate synthase (ferredoxin)
MLGADEYGFSTAPLIATGCIMMRACHLNTCPVGIATQDPELRKRFKGTPEHVVNFFFFVAEELRGIMASLGIRTFEEMIGRVDLLEADAAIDHWKARGIDLTHLLTFPRDVDADAPRHRTQPPPAVLDDALDHLLLERARPVVEGGDVHVDIETPVRNVNRCVGGMLSSRIAELHGREGLPAGSIDVRFTGSAGQSFGGWLAPGVTFTLNGDANDYTAKGLSGGTVVVTPPRDVTFAAEDNVIVGNTVLYGATSGKAFFRGLAGERFAVRNSGASAVIEGVGDHGCEYMTGGRVVVLGPTGRNFAAGMSGGLAFVLDADGGLRSRVNPAMLDQLEELTDEDAAELRALVEEHVARTGSPAGQRILDDFDGARGQFLKVFPADYKRVLDDAAAAAEAAEPPSAEEFAGVAVDVVGEPHTRIGEGE